MFKMNLTYMMSFISGPILYSILKVSWQLIFSHESTSSDNLASDREGGAVSQATDDTAISVTAAAVSYSSSADDRKASQGCEDDVYMLKTHGYRKYRFVSRSFLKRNQLSYEEDDLDVTESSR